MQYKYKIGDIVKVSAFPDFTENIHYNKDSMEQFDGRTGEITDFSEGYLGYKVLGWTWPESAVSLVEKIIEDYQLY